MEKGKGEKGKHSSFNKLHKIHATLRFVRSGKEELLRGEVEVFKGVHLRHEQRS